MSRTVLVAAGGTGGHLFPAESLAAELGRRGFTVDLATDERADRYGRAFPARAVHIIASETVRGRSPAALARTAAKLGLGFLQAWRLLGRIRPAAVVGFGGYPTVPPMLAAALRGVPTILHDQNAVMGRANRGLAKRATRIALSFAKTRHAESFAAKAVHTGNPVRDMVMEAATIPYDPPQPGGDFRLLVFGGSQGARFFSEAVPPALERLPAELRARLKLVQQVRPEDLEATRAALSRLGIEAETAPFFVDLPARIARSHLVVCRSGASTVGELAVIGRPAIMVPLPHALDQDQAENARTLEEAGGGWTIRQADLTPERLAGLVGDFMREPGRLAAAAAAARGEGRPDAVKRLADLVEAVAR
ncbi:undecaprenyldiphospho-muramoylpentapeptide beta-N-acetylglucosaminyltransferase [Prosthecomicrobium sp. N25]|uniref:undecaprenyldiphospho-muramoylpentapeptide beta-N-acetylglucosaminyltransferase n=1 Tax=Prosthecomicrobium sp. N25 TaxID=3129254 RepID=UPI0030783C39